MAGSGMGGWGREGKVRGRVGANRGFVYIPPSPFVFMPMLSRVNGKDQWQIIIGRVDSGSGRRGSETGFVSIWEFVAVQAFIMKLNEARKCLVGHGQNAAPLMFSWQFWHESVQDRNIANCNSVRCSCWFTICKQFSGCAVRFTRCQINPLYTNKNSTYVPFPYQIGAIALLSS